MNRVIHKHVFNNIRQIPHQTSNVDMPRGSTILKVGVQDDKIVVWYELNPDEPNKDFKTFRFIWTGFVYNKHPGKYLDTVQTTGLVWHVFVAS